MREDQGDEMPDNDRMVSRWGFRSALVLILALAILPASSGIAAAHYAGGLAASASRCEIRGVDPPVAGLRVTEIEAGAGLEIGNRTGATVDVLPEPGADRLREPTVPPGGTARWSDRRIVAAAQGPDPPTHRRSWAIPVQVGEQMVTIHGEQVWPPPPPTGRWWVATGLVALAAAVIGALAVGRRWAAALLGSATVAIAAAHVTHLLGSTLVLPPDQPMLAMVLGLAGPAIAAWPLGVLGPVLAFAGHSSGPMVCGLFGVLLVLFSASDVVGFFYAVLPFAWSPDLDRAATALVVGGGFGLFLAGVLALRALSRAVLPDAQPSSTVN
jgi:hypothetical protein